MRNGVLMILAWLPKAKGRDW